LISKDGAEYNYEKYREHFDKNKHHFDASEGKDEFILH
jgi:hypothetical protein